MWKSRSARARALSETVLAVKGISRARESERPARHRARRSVDRGEGRRDFGVCRAGRRGPHGTCANHFRRRSLRSAECCTSTEQKSSIAVAQRGHPRRNCAGARGSKAAGMFPAAIDQPQHDPAEFEADRALGDFRQRNEGAPTGGEIPDGTAHQDGELGPWRSVLCPAAISRKSCWRAVWPCNLKS